MTHAGIRLRLLAVVSAMFIVDAVGNAAESEYSDLFPHATPGWTADRVAAKVLKDPILGDNLQLSRSYRNVRRKSQITISIRTVNCMGAATIKEAHKENRLHQRPHDFAGYQGVEFGPEGRTSGITLIVENCKTIDISSEGDASREDITEYLKAIDFKKIKEFEGLPLGLF